MKTILITGCSTGFGRVTAAYLAERGWRVLATVRQEAHRAELLAEAGAKGLTDRLIPIVCDVTRAGDVERLARAVAEVGPGLDALLNNAGTSLAGPLELLPLDEVRALFEVNLFGPLAVAQALLPALKLAGGTLINVSSIGGRVSFPMYGPYHMSKFALEAMSDVLRLELAHFGVKVVIVAPGASPTAIWETTRRRAHSSPLFAAPGDYGTLAQGMEQRARQAASSGFEPVLFARSVWKIVNSPRPAAIYFVPRSAGLIVAARRLLPDRWWDWAARQILHW